MSAAALTAHNRLVPGSGPGGPIALRPLGLAWHATLRSFNFARRYHPTLVELRVARLR